MIRLHLLGPPRVAGLPAKRVAALLAGAKRLALFAYLGYTPGQVHRRDKLLALFWPELDEPHARNALRNLLHQVRQIMGEGVLVGQRDQGVGVSADRVWCDVPAFTQAVEEGQSREALALYSGDLLEGFHVDGMHEFDAWVAQGRGRLKGLAAGAAWAVAHDFVALGHLSDAELAARQARNLSSMAEGEVRRFIGALAAAGDRAAALRFYKQFEEALAQELELRPDAGTRKLVADIRASMGSAFPDARRPIAREADEAVMLDRIRTALADRYLVQRMIATGGMAAVYLADDLRHGRRVALKVLNPELAAVVGPERFLREVKTTARLQHPHILPLYDSGRADGLLYYVMPFVEGESLRERIDREKQLRIDEAVRITQQVSDALSHAHSHGVIHRDIKPENILLTAGHAMVADFGIARAVTVAGEERLTQTGIALGAPAYMSPEQSTAEREVDGRSDIYSLACVLYEMLAGEPPYTGPNALAVVAKRLSEPLPRVSVVRDTVPQGVERALARALAKVPTDRFTTAAQFAEALVGGLDDSQPALPPAARPGRRRLRLGGALLLAAALSVTVWWSMSREPASPGIRALAVLPFRSLMSDSTQDYFVEGMQEALSAELSKISALRVISSTPATRYRDTDKTLPQLAQELGVDGLIGASFLRDGDRVRITVQLIHGPSGRLLWAEQYERQMRDVLGLQGEVARAIAGQIHVSLTPGEESRLKTHRAVDAEAHEAYLKGRYFHNRLWTPEQANCIDSFRDAIDRQPDYAEAYAGLAECYTMLAFVGWAPNTVFPPARQAAERAVALDSTMSDAYVALAHVALLHEWDWDATKGNLDTALRLNPNSASAHRLYSVYWAFLGDSLRAIDEAREAASLDPVSLLMTRNLSWVYIHVRRYQEAAAQSTIVLDLAPENMLAKFDLAWSQAFLGVRHEVTAELELHNEGLGPVLAAIVLSTLGEREPALRKLELAGRGGATSYADPFWIAAVYAALGDSNEAMSWLEKAYREHSPSMVQLRSHPGLDPLRGDPRFQEIVSRMRFPSP